ncbi:long-chain fatty acid--CoA ligase [Shouchella rhizosphaerae]|uniref:long-chain fatty acid--CoA ligase n=1 Tax=Shouchella rhizosphaerae TaxID=866786 RepID=UPI00091A36AA|nr:long-chain fatty acid--CoA ligase [Shouchella rhizosphaerae]SHL84403.1 fatty-acyl-CoA synthase [Shouchella rhizosphaerae]
MMNTPLTISSMLERAERYFPNKTVVSRTHDNIYRYTYAEIGKRTRALASALTKLGLKRGERVGTIAWNHHRHLEAYFAAPGIGSVLHMINMRLPPDHLAFVINHASDRILLIDEDVLPLVEAIRPQLETVHAFVVMTDKDQLPSSTLEPLYSYEALLAEGDDCFAFCDDIDENEQAAMCYTSATTGMPKGVEYSHRGIVLHSLVQGHVDTTAISENDVCMPVVPMFHVNAWGLPFSATFYGATQVLPGPAFTPQLLAELIEKERVTFTGGVPTVWLGLLQVLEHHHYDLSSLRAVICGGSAAPQSMIERFERKLNVPFYHAYGLTETAPLVSFSRLKSHQKKWGKGEQYQAKAKQGMAVPLIDIKGVNANGEIPWNGEEMGELLIRGPWVANRYFHDERSTEAFKDGWFHTGDVVTIDEEGAIKIVDRTKDLIKSGGEWISSVDLENAIMSHEAVLEAAVVAVPHDKWQERPVACVVLKNDKQATKEEIVDYLKPQFAKWWLPDDVVFMEALPKTSVGKFLKRALRKELFNQSRFL